MSQSSLSLHSQPRPPSPVGVSPATTLRPRSHSLSVTPRSQPLPAVCYSSFRFRDGTPPAWCWTCFGRGRMMTFRNNFDDKDGSHADDKRGSCSTGGGCYRGGCWRGRGRRGSATCDDVTDGLVGGD
ncbi:hypothetical protein HN51_032535 [Arachis hypogaea]